MNDQTLEMQDDEVIIDEAEQVEVDGVETDEETIEEAKKASFGDPSEVPDPTNVKAVAPVTKKPTTKAGMITAMADLMKGKKKDELSATYEKMLEIMQGVTESTEVSSEAQEVVSIKEVRKLSREDINVAEDVAAIFGGEDLSEDFREKATTIFEAAVLSKVNEVLESVTIDFEAELEVEKKSISEDLATKLDDYLEYVAEEWMKENEIAVEQGIRAEIAENFMSGLRTLFQENYIEVPEEKADLLDEMVEKLSQVEESLSEEMNRNIALKKQINDLQRAEVFENVSEGLTQTQIEKFESLAEGVDFDDEESFKNKLETIKENYFHTEEVSLDNDADDEPLDDSVITEEATQNNGSMANYMNAISRSIKK